MACFDWWKDTTQTNPFTGMDARDKQDLAKQLRSWLKNHGHSLVQDQQKYHAYQNAMCRYFGQPATPLQQLEAMRQTQASMTPDQFADSVLAVAAAAMFGSPTAPAPGTNGHVQPTHVQPTQQFPSNG